MTIPGPKSTPTVQSFHWYARPLDFMRECVEKYGDPFRIELSRFGEHACFSAPMALRDIFTTHADKLDAGLGNEPLRALLGDHSLLTLDGRDHRRHRRLLKPAFHGPQLSRYADKMLAVACAAVAAWPAGEPVAVYPRLLELSLKIILETIFGFRDPERKRDLELLIHDLLHHSNVSLSFFETFADSSLQGESPTDTLEWLRQRSSRLDALLYQEIESRRAETGVVASDVLMMLLKARDEAGEPLEAVEVHDELLTLLVAGHETAAAALAWALVFLAQNPAAQKRAAEEAMGDVDDASRLAGSGYLQAVCSESLRMMPVIPVVSRMAQVDLEIDGHPISAGTRVTPCIYLTHHRADIWHEPERFRPSRFLERIPSPYQFLPFGGGARRCIGAAFAMREMAIVLGVVLSRFEVRLASDPPRPLRTALLMTPSEGARLVLEPRPQLPQR